MSLYDCAIINNLYLMDILAISVFFYYKHCYSGCLYTYDIPHTLKDIPISVELNTRSVEFLGQRI